MALVQKGPTKKKKTVQIAVLFIVLLITFLSLYFGIIRKSAPVQVSPVLVPDTVFGSLDQGAGETASSEVTVPAGVRGIVEFFQNLPQWNSLKLPKDIATTTPARTGRPDPFEVIRSIDPESYNKGQ